MKKAVRTISIIALVFSILSLISFIAVLLLRNLLGPAMGYGQEMLFVLPISSLLSIIGAVIVSLFVLLCGANKNIGIWAEILLIVLAVAVIPFVSGIASSTQMTMLGTRGVDYMYSLSAINGLINFAASPATTARMLALVVCGMSIAHKKLAPTEAPLYPPMGYTYAAPQQPPYPAPRQNPNQQPPM